MLQCNNVRLVLVQYILLYARSHDGNAVLQVISGRARYSPFSLKRAPYLTCLMTSLS